ncbi:MAG TPA: M20/M25/M40 family metallo-hydrolase [Gemmatimonadaceae bacterium]|nr:M20/M25/M40 family metallo-hydrolase [Gemmatimonadaceae bacterium]
MKRHLVPAVRNRFFGAATALALALPVGAQEKVDTAAINRIKAEGFDRSQVMEIASWLTDVFGARLTGSPNIKNAGDWAVKKLGEWGAVNARLEPWGYFGRGWTNEFTSAHMVAPTSSPIIAVPAAWTPGTNGPVTAEVIQVTIDSASDFPKYRGKLRGKFVMMTPPRELTPRFTADAERYSEAELDQMAAAEPTPPRGGGAGRGGRAGGAGRGGGASLATQRTQFLIDEGVAAIITVGRGDMGTIFTTATGSRDPQNPTRLPTVIFAAEHYNRIVRILEKGVPVRVELNVKNTFHDRDLNAFNVVAELPGTDPQLRDELVMLGAHFDSWHAGTGATDNAAGSAVMMEAMRILKATGLPLRRTVRIGLWTGEENGLLGSRAYVRQHFGSPTDTANPVKPAHEKFSGYFNVDNGTGKIRGVYLQGNAAVGPIFKDWMKPFEALGMRTVTIRNTGGTDHGSFDGAGLPGWQFIQDGVEYDTRTHHSNMDVYDRLVADDMRHNAVVVAAFVYLAANRDEKLPRKALPRIVQ